MYSTTIHSGTDIDERYKAIKFLAIIAITAMMAIPIIQHIQNEYASTPVESYSYHNEMVRFVGSNAFIGFDGNMFPVSWNVFSPEQNRNSITIVKELFTHYTTKRIESVWQNSAVMIKWNHYVKIAEIFSFTNNGIDASIVVKNLNVTNTYISTFSLGMGVNSTMNVNGFNPSCQNISSGTGIIPSSDWNVSVGNISVNWQSEDSIFHSGIVSETSLGDQIILPFETGVINHNQSYTIDPMIYYSPYRIIGGPRPGPGPSPSPTPTPQQYSVTFTESGLPSGTSWYVTLNGVTETSTSDSITFSEYDGSYSYSVGLVNGYTDSPSSGSVSVNGGSRSISIVYTEQPTDQPSIGYIGVQYSCYGETSQSNLTQDIINQMSQAGTTYDNVLMPGARSTLEFSIPYQNADAGSGQVNTYASVNNPTVSPDEISGPPSGNGGTPFRGMLVYTLTANGGWDYPIYCNQDLSGSGTLTFSWVTQPGVYGGFMVELVNNNGMARSYYNHNFDVYSRLVQSCSTSTTSPSIQDSYATNTLYTSQGIYIGTLGITASGGPTTGSPTIATGCKTNTQLNMGLSSVFFSPQNDATTKSYTYGVFNYDQYLNYTGCQYGGTGSSSSFAPVCSLNQAYTGSSTNSQSTTKEAIEAIYSLIEIGAIASSTPCGYAVGFTMAALSPFLFQGSAPAIGSDNNYWEVCHNEAGLTYGNWNQGGSGPNTHDVNIMPANAEPVWSAGGYYVNPSTELFCLVNNGNGNPSLVQYLFLHMKEASMKNVGNPNQEALNFYTYTTTETIVPIAHSVSSDLGGVYQCVNNDYVNATSVSGNYEYTGPSYTVATTLPLYLPLVG